MMSVFQYTSFKRLELQNMTEAEELTKDFLLKRISAR
jgi:hypothetical protein